MRKIYIKKKSGETLYLSLIVCVGLLTPYFFFFLWPHSTQSTYLLLTKKRECSRLLRSAPDPPPHLLFTIPGKPFLTVICIYLYGSEQSWLHRVLDMMESGAGLAAMEERIPPGSFFQFPLSGFRASPNRSPCPPSGRERLCFLLFFNVWICVDQIRLIELVELVGFVLLIGWVLKMIPLG